MKILPVCVFEDREECLLGIKLLILSARHHEPMWVFYLYVRNMSEDDLSWLTAQPNVILRTAIPTEQKGWNVKPSLLLELLKETGGPVLWCDSDIILTSPISRILDSIPDTVLLAAEEYGWGRHKGSKARVAGWNLKEGRSLAVTVNSCFMRMSPCHLPLLNDWDAALSYPTYVDAQSRAWDQRPLHLMGDQDVLTALLASSEHAQIPLFLLRSGKEIAQCFEEDGYTVQDRLINALRRRLPPLIHAQGGKPWKSGVRATFQQLSPYNKVAIPYLASEGLPDHWTTADDDFLKKIERLFLNDANLCGLIHAFSRTVRRVWNHRPKFARRTVAPKY